MDFLLPSLGEEVLDASEETFHLFSQPSTSQNLGMLDPKAPSLDLTIGSRDFTLTQSPGLLQSNRSNGTTGAAIWQTSVRFAEWLSLPGNVLFKSGVLGPGSVVLELGAGVSGLNACILAEKVARVVTTDQDYALKLLKENVTANHSSTPPKKSRTAKLQAPKQRANVEVLALDWETDSVPAFLFSQGLAANGVDIVVACDCIYNYALIDPFVQTCKEICEARRAPARGDGNVSRQTVVVVAQHLRQPDVFEQWAETFTRAFQTWRVREESLTKGLGEGSGFAVHVGVLR